MAILSEISIRFFLCIVISQLSKPALANPSSPPAEDLQDEYYTVTPAMTDQFVPQDEKDANTIHESNNQKVTVASILPYREKERRYAINVKMGSYTLDPEQRWFSETWSFEQGPFDDLGFALVEKESTVLSCYLKYFKGKRDKQRIGFGMVLTKDMHDMTVTFNVNFHENFENFSDKPYSGMMKSWVKKNRDPLEKDLKQDSVTEDAKDLNKEYNKGYWLKSHKHYLVFKIAARENLDRTIFRKSITYARAVMTEFENLNGGKAIEEIISSSGLDKDLVNTYVYFARYIKNKHKFIAEMLFENSSGKDRWCIWIMCIAVIHPQEWPKVDEAFKQCSKGTSLAKFITDKIKDKIMAEMMAVIMDPTFKPTQFQPESGQSLYPSSVPPTKPANP